MQLGTKKTGGSILDTTAPRESAACKQFCPVLVQEALSIIGTKWAPGLLLTLRAEAGPLGFGELKRRTEGVTAKELSRHLKRLVEAQLVQRTVHPTNPPRVDYELSTLGEHFCQPLETLADWGARFVAQKQIELMQAGVSTANRG